MSLETWKAEFYPKKAQDCSKEEALEHSIRKWEGLTPKNLEKHRVQWSTTGLRDKSSNTVLWMHMGNCALCQHYYNADSELDEDSCQTCPLHTVRGQSCDSIDLSEVYSPYAEYTRNGNPQPMLDLLYAARKMVEVKNNSPAQPEGQTEESPGERKESIPEST